LDLRSTTTNQSLIWETFWFTAVACMPIIDQISTVFRGETTEQIISVSLLARACVGIGLLVFIIEHRFQNTGSIRRLGMFCALFGILVLYASVYRWNSDVFAKMFRVFWWLIFLYCTYSAIQSGIVRRSILFNAILVSASVQLLSLLATPLIGHLGMGMRESTYVEVGAVSGLFYSTKGVAQSLALILPVIWFRFKPGILRSAYVFVILLAIAFTFSRTAIAAALVSLTILVFTGSGSAAGRIRGSRRIAASLVISLVIVVAIIMFIGWERISYRWTMGIGTEGLGSGRLVFWRSAFLEWYRGDIVTIPFGKGLGASLDILEKSYGRIWCHNDFLELLVCQGLMGLIAYIALLLFIVKTLCGSWRVNQNNGPAWALVGGFLTCSFLSGMLYQLDVIGTFVVAFAVMTPTSHNLLTANRFKSSENLYTGHTS